MSEQIFNSLAEADWVANLEAVVTRRSACSSCGYGTEDPERPGFCRNCGGALVFVEPKKQDVGVISGLTRLCPECGYPNDYRRNICKICDQSLAEIVPTNRSFLSQLVGAWRAGWQKGI